MSHLFLSKKKLSIAFLFLLPILAYLNTLHHGFVWDDKYVLVDNAYIRSIGNFPDFFTSFEAQNVSSIKIYRPIRQVAYSLEYYFFGQNPYGYHLVNVLFHSLNTLVLFVFLNELFLRQKEAFLMAAIYAVHPVNTEAVANITGQTDTMFFLFYVLGLTLFLKSLNKKKRLPYYAGILILYLLSLFSKEMAISFPVIIILINLFAENGDWKKLQRNIYFFLVLAVLTVVFMSLRSAVIGNTGHADYYGDSFWITAFSQTAVHWNYIKICLIPYPLSARYDVILLETPFNLYTISFVFFILLLIGSTLQNIIRSRFSVFLLGCWWFLIALLPVSNILPIPAAMMGERYLYLPLVGLIIAVYAPLYMFFEKTGGLLWRVFLLSSVVVIAAFFMLTIERNKVWKSNRTLFEDTVKKAPDSLIVRWSLFKEYDKAGEISRAAEQYDEMLRINRETANDLLDIAKKYKKAGRIEDAERMSKKALYTKPDFEEAKLFLESLR